jgi:hypothetical protein
MRSGAVSGLKAAGKYQKNMLELKSLLTVRKPAWLATSGSSGSTTLEDSCASCR